MSAILVKGNIVHYEVVGRGKPVILLHGFLSSWKTWIPTMQILSKSYRVYAIDFWGFGDSVKGNTTLYTLAAYADLLQHFCDEIGIDPAIIGHSLGAIVGAQFKLSRGASSAPFIAVSAPIFPTMIKTQVLERASTIFQSESPLLAAVNQQVPLYTLMSSDYKYADPIAEKTILQEISRYDQLIQPVNAPTLFIYGENDEVISAPTQEQSDTLGKNASVVILHNSGYFPMIGNQEFQKLSLDYLSNESHRLRDTHSISAYKVEQKETKPKITKFSLVSKDTDVILTPHELRSQVAPYLEAFSNIQHVIDNGLNRSQSVVIIHSITYNSPIGVSVSGTGDVYSIVKDIAEPWRRKHEKEMARLDEEAKKSEILERRARASRDRIETQKAKEEIEKVRLENQKLDMEIKEKQTKLVLEIITQYLPNLSIEERNKYINDLLVPLGIILASPYSINDASG